jgi:hypothetical protein
LWIEDEKRFIEANGKVLQTYLEKLGFNLNIEKVINPHKTPVKDYLRNTSKYDLILVDWRFKDKPGAIDQEIGGEIIQQIRKKITYADIILYSGDRNFKNDFQEKALQGVYLSNRAVLKEEAKELINCLLHKTLHPKIMRGIIVSALSQIDDLCYQIIEKKYLKLSSKDKTAFLTTIRDTISNQATKHHEEKMKFIDIKDKDFIAGLQSTMKLDSHKRSLTVKNLAVADGLKDDILKPIKALPNTVVKRNKLAHWKRSEEDDTHILLTETDKPDYLFDQTEAANVRKSINDAAEALLQYLDSI